MASHTKRTFTAIRTVTKQSQSSMNVVAQDNDG
jgi:hypothetical protein